MIRKILQAELSDVCNLLSSIPNNKRKRVSPSVVVQLKTTQKVDENYPLCPLYGVRPLETHFGPAATVPVYERRTHPQLRVRHRFIHEHQD
jgi:hypothetical protein